MKEMLSSVKDKENQKKKDDEKTGTISERDLLVWRRKLDDLKSKSNKKAEHLQGIKDKFTDLEK